MQMNIIARAAMACTLSTLVATPAWAVNFGNDVVSGSFDSTLSVGFGRRAENPSAGLILQGNSGGPEGQLAVTSGLGDQGDLNYAKGDYFTQYVKGSHELLLKFPEQISFMARGNWVRDLSATSTTGHESVYTVFGGVPLNGEGYRSGLTDDARKDLRFKARMLDLWVSKTFDIGEQQTRVRVGQQVINWGESLFATGGINATNPLDAMRLSQPGAQIKEGILPTPAISVASGLGHGLNVEAYVQTRWKSTYLPPVGSYWSASTGPGRGQEAYGNLEEPARDSGQWGASLKFRPPSSSLDLGVYALNYHDKIPQLQFGTAAAPLALSFLYPEDRRLYGVSANFPVGDWAVGTELSYRPKEAVSLNYNFNPATGDMFCASRGGQCWTDEKKLQWHLTGLYALTPSNSGPLLQALGASTGTLLTELVVIHFPNLKQSYGGIPVASGGWGWGNETDPTASPVAMGSKTSSGLSLDFSLTYDGTLIPGWQVTPGIFMSYALSGHTPTLQGNYMKGAMATNLSVTFTRNPGNWQFGMNYARFSGGRKVLDNALRDRDFIGAYAQFLF